MRNSWVKCSKEAEYKIYVDDKNSLLSLEDSQNAQKPHAYYVKTLYDVLLEFSERLHYRDFLNSEK